MYTNIIKRRNQRFIKIKRCNNVMLVSRNEYAHGVALKYKSDLINDIDKKFQFIDKLKKKSGYKVSCISLMDINNNSDDGNETVGVKPNEIFPLSSSIREKINSANIVCVAANLEYQNKVFPFTIDKDTDEIIISS